MDTYSNPIIARMKEAIEDKSLVIYDREEKVEQRGIELFTLVSMRLNDMAAKDDALMAQIFSVVSDIEGKEWDRCLDVLRWAEDEAVINPSWRTRGLAKTVRDLTTAYFGEWILPRVMKAFARTFPDSQAAVQYVASIPSMMPGSPSSGPVTIKSYAESGE